MSFDLYDLSDSFPDPNKEAQQKAQFEEDMKNPEYAFFVNTREFDKLHSRVGIAHITWQSFIDEVLKKKLSEAFLSDIETQSYLSELEAEVAKLRDIDERMDTYLKSKHYDLLFQFSIEEELKQIPLEILRGNPIRTMEEALAELKNENSERNTLDLSFFLTLDLNNPPQYDPGETNDGNNNDGFEEFIL